MLETLPSIVSDEFICQRKSQIEHEAVTARPAQPEPSYPHPSGFLPRLSRIARFL